MSAKPHNASVQSSFGAHNVSQQTTHLVSTAEATSQELSGPSMSSVVTHLGVLSSVRNAPAFTLGGKWDTRIKDQGVPSPGTYPLVPTELYMSGSRTTTFPPEGRGRFPKASRDLEDLGPGSYPVPKPPRGRECSLSGRFQYKDEAAALEASPGPAAYSPRVQRDGRGIKFTKGGRAEERERTKGIPGPASYVVNYDQVGGIQRSPCYGLGSGERGERVDLSDGPGPGSYESVRPELPGFTVPTRHEADSLFFDRGDRTPGPGAYDPPQTSRSTTLGTMPRARERPPPGADGPPPGQYSPDPRYGAARVLGGRFGKAGRMMNSGVNKGDLGPGSYPHKDTIGKTAVSFPKSARGDPKAARADKSTEEGDDAPVWSVPGPTADPALGKSRLHGVPAPAFGFAKSARWSSPPSHAPIPVEELPRTLANVASGVSGHERKASSWSFGKAKRQEESRTNVPGPGTYTSAPLRLGAPTLTLKTRRAMESRGAAGKGAADTPGPGHYGIVTSMGVRSSPRRTPRAEASTTEAPA